MNIKQFFITLITLGAMLVLVACATPDADDSSGGGTDGAFVIFSDDFSTAIKPPGAFQSGDDAAPTLVADDTIKHSGAKSWK